MATEKQCSKCGETKSTCEFGKNRKHKDGLRSQCKTCTAEANKIYRDSHLEQIAFNKKRYNDAHRKQIAAHGRRYYETHRKQIAAYAKRWYEENRERDAENSKRYRESHREEKRECERRRYAENPEVSAAKARTRRARIAGAAVEDLDIQEVFDYWGPMCAYCGSTDDLTLDHIVPLSQGGSHSFDNLCVACRSCNASKGAKKLIEWMWCKARNHELAVSA